MHKQRGLINSTSPLNRKRNQGVKIIKSYDVIKCTLLIDAK